MLVIPAIDLKEGRCVRLRQGRADQETVYGEDPAAVARGFQQEGAEMLHLVDLDGAFRGKSANLDAIRAIRAAIDLPIELGGGMRTMADIEGMLGLGIDSVIVGTTAVRNPEVLVEALEKHGGEKIQLGVDARDGKVAVQGWEDETALDAVAFGLEWKTKGVARVIFTDIARDGMLTGPNLEAVKNYAKATGLRITASGGVSKAEDIHQLATLEPLGVDRVIVGKAIYEGTLKLSEVL